MTDYIQAVNEKTGELFDVVRPVIPFRTIMTAKEYVDGETYEDGTSMVDLTGYEPLESIIARCTRNVRGANANGLQVLDLEALKQEASGVMTHYDVDVPENPTSSEIGQAFDGSYDPTEAPGFDMVDAGEILTAVNDNVQKADLSPAHDEQSPQIAQAKNDAVEKSTAHSESGNTADSTNADFEERSA